jgi:peptide/nickel transport system substrate-binding protein
MLTYLIRLFRALTQSEKTVFYCCAFLAILAGIYSGRAAFVKYTTLQPAEGGEYVEGVVGQPTAINPMQIGSTGADKDLSALLFADLMTLAERYATSSTGKVWLIDLKDDLVWSDGKAITSDDVVFTVRTIQHPDAGSPLFANWQGVSVERVSQLQVRFTLRAPYSYFLDSLRELRIAPAHIFEGLPVSNIRLSSYNLEPVSSGPYVFDGYEKKRDGFITSYKLKINNDYAGERALIQSFSFSFFPTYQDALLAFGKKQIDGIGGITKEQADSIRINHVLHESALPQYYALFFNPSVTPILKNKTVRQALSLATDKELIIRDVLGKKADISHGPFSTHAKEYSSSTYANEHYSIDEAKDLLAKQGWKPGADGVLARSVGKSSEKLSIEISVPDIGFLSETAKQIKSQWEKIGVLVSIKTYPAENIDSEVIAPRAYQVLLFGNMLGASADLFSFWHSSQRFEPGLNFSLYQNSQSDKMIEAARNIFDDEARKEVLSKLQAQILSDAPAIFLYSPHYLYASPTNLGGFSRSLIKSPQDRLGNVEQWYLETERVFSNSQGKTEGN